MLVIKTRAFGRSWLATDVIGVYAYGLSDREPVQNSALIREA